MSEPQSKVDLLEIRLENYVSKIDQRLDQIVTLMQAVAALQEKEARNSDAIKELKDGIKESVDKFEKTVDRIHVRLAHIIEEQEREKDALFDQIRSANSKTSEVNEKVDKWVNRGIGLWSGISIFVVVVQSVGGYMLSEFKKEFDQQKVQITEVTKRQNDLENDISRINSTVRSIQK